MKMYTKSTHSSFSKHLSLTKVGFELFRIMFTLPKLFAKGMELVAKLDAYFETLHA